LPALSDVALFADPLACELLAVPAETFQAASVPASKINQIRFMICEPP
jgi:hypothetical protein